MHRDRPLPDELNDTADLLRSDRASLDPHTDQRLRTRLERAARPARARRSSMAIALCLMFGALFSAGGTSLAVSGLGSDDVTAKSAQYPTTTTPPAPTSTTAPSGDTDVLGEEGSQSEDPADEAAGGSAPASGDGDEAGVAGESDSADPGQPARQVAASNAEGLPFTGYAAVPLLLLGVALLASGAMLRRRTRFDV